MVKNLPTVQETWARSLGGEDPLEEKMATDSSILDWRIPGTEEPVGGRGVATVHGISESDITERQTCTQVARGNGKLNFTGVPSPSRRVSLTEAVRGHSRTFPHYYTTLAMLSILSKININFKK